MNYYYIDGEATYNRKKESRNNIIHYQHGKFSLPKDKLYVVFCNPSYISPHVKLIPRNTKDGMVVYFLGRGFRSLHVEIRRTIVIKEYLRNYSLLL
jgi:hypothetical protein